MTNKTRRGHARRLPTGTRVYGCPCCGLTMESELMTTCATCGDQVCLECYDRNRAACRDCRDNE